MAEADMASLDTVLHDLVLEKGSVNQVNKAHDTILPILRTTDGALRAVATINSLLAEDVGGVRKYHVLKRILITDPPEAAEEIERCEMIRKLVVELAARLESTNYGDSNMLFMESIEAAMEGKSSAFKTPPRKISSSSSFRKLFSSEKGTRRELDEKLKQGKPVDPGGYSPSVIAEEIMMLLEEASPLLCEEEKAVFNKYLFVQAKNEGWAKVRGFITLISALPTRNQVLLKALFELLNAVWEHSDATGMDDDMLAFSLAPRLLRPERTTKVESVMNSRAFVNGAVLVILRNSEVICRTPSIVLSQAAFDCLQKVVDTLSQTLSALLPSESRGIILAIEDLLKITESIRAAKAGKVDKKYPFLRFDFGKLPTAFWLALASIRKEEGKNPVDIAKFLLSYLHLGDAEDELIREVSRDLTRHLQVSEEDVADIVSAEKVKTLDVKEESPRRSVTPSSAPKFCAAGNCEQFPVPSLNTKYCRYHFEEFRVSEDPHGERRVRGKKPGRNCDILTSLPAMIFDADLGLKLSSSASFFLHTNSSYRTNLVYDIQLRPADGELQVCTKNSIDTSPSSAPSSPLPSPPCSPSLSFPPSPSSPSSPLSPSSSGPLEEWSLTRKRRAPPPLSGLLRDVAQLKMTEEEVSKFVLTTVQETLTGEYGHIGSLLDTQDAAALQPPVYLNMTQPHMKMVWEIISTEEAYVKILKFVADHFVAKLRAGNSCGLTLDEVDLLFRNIARMSNFHVKFLSDLYRRFCTWTDDVDTQLIGEMFINFDESFRVYPSYVNKHDEALELLRRINANPGKYAKFLQMQRDALQSPLSQGRDLASCLISPVQRIPRYRLLIEEVLKQYAKAIPDHPDIPNLEKALQIILVYANQVNEQLRRSEQERDMLALKEELTGAEKHGQLVTGARYLIHRGNLMRVCRKSVRVYHFLLFNDLLIYAVKSSSQPGRVTYTIQKWIPIDETFSVSPSQPGRWQVRSKVKSFEMFPDDPAKYELWNQKFLSLTQQQSDGTAEAAPLWEPDSKIADCPGCQRKFTVVRRKHHCRDCGAIVCGQCSSQKLVLSTSNGKSVRVCDSCFEARKAKRSTSISDNDSTLSVSSSLEPRYSAGSRRSVSKSRRESLRILFSKRTSVSC